MIRSKIVKSCLSALVMLSFLDLFAFRQSFDGVVCGRTSDFSSFDQIKFPVKCQAEYESKLLEMLNQRVGVYCCDKFSRPDVKEWRGVKKIYLYLHADARVQLFLEDNSGRYEAPRTENGVMSERALFLGPKSDGVVFLYSCVSNMMYTLLSPNGCQIPLAFRKVSRLPLAAKLPDRSDRIKYSLAIPPDISRLRGWYRQKRMTSMGRMYLRLDGTGGREIYYKKNGCFWYDDNKTGMMPHWTGGMLADLGYCAVLSSGCLSFHMPPPSFDCVERSWQVQLGRRTCSTQRNSRQQTRKERIERDIMEVLHEYFEIDGDRCPKRIFEPVDDVKLTKENLRVIRDGTDVTSDEWKERFLTLRGVSR